MPSSRKCRHPLNKYSRNADLDKMEKYLEDAIVALPSLVEDGLTLEARQMTLPRGRFDLLFRDRHGRLLLIELKWGPIRNDHIHQLLNYEDYLIEGEKNIRVMLIGTRVPERVANTLDHHGIEFKVLDPLDVTEALARAGNQLLARSIREGIVYKGRVSRRSSASAQHVVSSYVPMKSIGCEGTHLSPLSASSIPCQPALLSVIGPQWVAQAVNEFARGKREIYFGANTKHLMQALHLPIRRVFFKTKGTLSITWVATFVGITESNIPEKRLNGCEHESQLYYYGFSGLTRLESPIALESLRRFSTGNFIKNQVQASCVICDPFD